MDSEKTIDSKLIREGFADFYENYFSFMNYSPECLNRQMKDVPPNIFDSDNIEDYNMPLKIKEFNKRLTNCETCAFALNDIVKEFLTMIPEQNKAIHESNGCFFHDAP